jgi:sulfatase-like protein
VERARLKAPPPLGVAGLHLLVLSSFALAQPLFDLLGKNGEFFAARGSSRWDVVAFALALLLVPPAVLLGLEAASPRRARGTVHAVFVAALTGLLVLQAIRGAGGAGWLLVALAGAIGLAAAALYLAWPVTRLVLTMLAPAPVLFLALFLLHSDASRLTLSGTPSALAAGVRARAPVVVVVFDELPTNSLLDRRGRVDAARFPHFAALARGSVWFANESVVSEGTLHGVPSLLTGRYPHSDELPVYHDHPRNLFTLLGGRGELHVVETETHLCPPKLCRRSTESFGRRLGALYADTSVVYLHQLLPEDLARGIPSISNGWQDFWHNGLGGSDPLRRFQRFLPTIRPTNRPALWYLHVLLPHSPWRFLPSGKRYEIRQPPGWSSAEIWTDNQAAVDEYWQRHLLQLGFADRLLGKLVARLRAAGLYERSLLVVTADEGLSFRAGEKRRPASAANLQDIAYVPLIFKLPHQRRGRVVRLPTQSVDVLPTLAAALGVRIPWHVDGQDALSAKYRERAVMVAKDHGSRFVVPASRLEAKRDAALRRQLALFGSDEPLSTLYGIGPFRALLGRPPAGLRIGSDDGGVALDGLDLSTDPVQVSGRVRDSVHDVALAAGGRIVAVVRAEQGRFWALVPRAALDRGTPELYSIEGPRMLRRLTS